MNHDDDEVSYIRAQRRERVRRRERELVCFYNLIKYLTVLYAVSIILYAFYYLRIEKAFDFKGPVEDSC